MVARVLGVDLVAVQFRLPRPNQKRREINAVFDDPAFFLESSSGKDY